MQYLVAGDRELIELEPEEDVIRSLADQAGFDCVVADAERSMVIEVTSRENEPLLLFDAGDQANLGWFSRCQFYVDGLSGAVLQTPLQVANCRDAQGKLLPNLRISISKQLPTSYRLPGQQSINEQLLYSLLFNLLTAFRDTGVAVCGKGVITPLVGRSEKFGSQN